MSLGFTVEELIPAGRGGGALRMGLSRVEEASWLQPDFDAHARATVFAEHPEAITILPGAQTAAEETARLVAQADSFRDAATACWEDLCVLEADSDDSLYRLTAAAVGFPTDWRLEDKIGKPLDAIHEPIHGYAEQLSAGVNHFFRKLEVGPIFGRANWFIVAGDAWRYLPDDEPEDRFAHVTAHNAGDTLFVRCERQTLRRLPETRAVLFTIGVAVEPLCSLSLAAVRYITDAVAAISGGEHARRAMPFYAEALSDYTANRTMHEETIA